MGYRGLPFFAELPDGVLVQVTGRKVIYGAEETSYNIAYETLGTYGTNWKVNLQYIKIHRDIVEKDFPEYVI